MISDNIHYTSEDVFQERVSYNDTSLPIHFCRDNFVTLLNGELGCHWHGEFEFGIVLRGEVEYTIRSGSQQETAVLCAGDGVFINTSVLHAAHATKPDTFMFCVSFPPSIFSSQPHGSLYTKNVLPVIQLSIPGVFLRSESEEKRSILMSLRNLFVLSDKEIGYEMHCIELIFHIWRSLMVVLTKLQSMPKISRSTIIHDARTKAMLSYIHSHFAESLTIERIADAANVSRGECFRCFKEVVGKSPVEYITEYRLSQAAMLLAGTEGSVLSIGCACGYDNPSYFSKLFRKKSGMSPCEFRAHARSAKY